MVAKVGKKAPQFTLKDSDGNKISLKDYLGKGVIIYFYPKDMTPGCTTQACDFRDSIQPLKKKGYVVLGISCDSEESHQKFIAKHDLNFTLLSDPDAEVCQKFGVWQQKNTFGNKHMGIVRSTFIIDKNGIITHAFEKVTAQGHVEELLAVL